MARKPSHMDLYRAPVAAGDLRLESPVFHRNGAPIIDALRPLLKDRTGPALEIGSGSGQHIAALSKEFSGIDWHASDPEDVHLASIRAWVDHLGAPVRGPIHLDAASDWAASVAGFGPFSLVMALNVIHIAPVAVLGGIATGAGKILAPDGILVFYGPFREHGHHTGDGNRAFDDRLRSENPAWGIRDIDEVDDAASGAGLVRAELIAMPANNRLLVYRKPQE